MNVGSTFSGVGGFDLGFERAGMSVVWQAEIDEWCRRVLRWHWPEAQIYNDVKDVGCGVGDRLPNAVPRNRGGDTDLQYRKGEADYKTTAAIDLLCGGFPCQDLSVAGKRAGFKGERSSLFFEFARIADEFRPRWIVLENVVGLLSSAEGRDFGILLSTLAEIGYGCAWRVVDARFFGVPQRRRRVFIVGCLADDGQRAVRALAAGGEGNLEAGECSWQYVAASVAGGVRGASGVKGWPATIAPPLNASFGDKLGLEDQHALSGARLFVPNNRTIGALNTGSGRLGHNRDDQVAVDLISKPLSTSNQRLDPGVESFVVEPASVTSFAQNQRGELRESDPVLSGNRTTDIEGGAYVGHCDSSVRRLTPTECERLMAWPDGWTAVDGDKTPDGRRYAACGNGVVANVSEWIGRRIMAIEDAG